MIYLLQVSTCWVIFFAIYALFLKKETFFSVNRYYLLGALATGLLIPYLGALLPANTASTEVYTMMSEVTITSQAAPAAQSFSWSYLLYAFYLIGCLIVASKTIYGLYRIWSIYRSGSKEVKENFTMVRSHITHLPFSFFRWVFISDKVQLQGDMLDVIEHEKLHVSQWHSVDILFTECLQIFFWFNPVLIFYKKALRESHEYLADAFVTNTTEKYSYGQLLLGQSTSGIEIALANQFFNSQIKKRMKMMYKERSSKPAMVKYLAAVPVLALLLVIFSSNVAFKKQKFDKINVKSEVVSYLEGHQIHSDLILKYVTTLTEKYPENRKELSDIFDEISPIKGFAIDLSKDPSEKTLCVNWDSGSNAVDKIHPVLKAQQSQDAEQEETGWEIVADQITLVGYEDPTNVDRATVSNGDPLIVVDGKVKGTDKSIYSDIDPEDIASVNVLKGEAAIEKYGEQGKDGVIEIILKKGKQAQNEIYKVVEEMPRFVGCEEVSDKNERQQCAKRKMLEHLYMNIKYPSLARDNGTEGMVVVQFIIRKDGSITDITLLRDIGSGCGEEAMRVVKTFPKWKPGVQNGKIVDVQYVLPVRYKLEGDETSQEVTKLDEASKDMPTVVAMADVDEKALFPGTDNAADSQEALLQMVYTSINYPEEARVNEIEGITVVKFVINEKGYITDHEIARPLGWGIDEVVNELIEKLTDLDPWTPAKKNDKSVASEFFLPIKFKLEGPKEDDRKILFKDFKVMPNPSSGVFNLVYETESEAISSITVYDLQGRVLRVIDGNIGAVDQQIDIREYNVDAAIINIVQDGLIHSEKIIVRR